MLQFNKHPPATPEQIETFSSATGLTLPPDYKSFLSVANGGEGMVGTNAYLILWGIEELTPLNKAYQVEKYVPGLLFFGSDGGGEAYAFNTCNKMRVVRVPFVGMGVSTVQPIAENFTDFLEYLCGL